MSDKFVLLVEDNPDDVALTQMAFRRCQISKWAMCGTGEEALDFLFSQGKYADGDPGQEPA